MNRGKPSSDDVCNGAQDSGSNALITGQAELGYKDERAADRVLADLECKPEIAEEVVPRFWSRDGNRSHILGLSLEMVQVWGAGMEPG